MRHAFPQPRIAGPVSLGLFVSAMLVANLAEAHPEIPGKAQTRPIVLVGATIHPVTGPAIPAGNLVFDQGKITAVGKRVSAPPRALRVELGGKHVYPSLFDASTNLGLVEISAVRATRDQREAGQIHPNVKSWVAINPDSEAFPVTRSNGVLLALTAPTGGLLSGRSAVLQLDGWNWRDMALVTDVGLHVNWPSMAPVVNLKSGATSKSEDRNASLALLEKAFADARAYQTARTADELQHPRDARWESLLGVLQGQLPVIVRADEVQQIQAAVAFADRQQVRVILLGGYDAPHCAESLKRSQIPVIIEGVYRLPRRRSEPYDTPFTVPVRLHQAGVRFCISGDSATTNVRNLPYHAAMAAAFGLPKDEALKSITLYPAQILGVADRVGSLDVGKDATLIVTDGDPLETPTQVEAAYIQGRKVDLTDRHKRLWKKYGEKIKRR